LQCLLTLSDTLRSQTPSLSQQRIAEVDMDSVLYTEAVSGEEHGNVEDMLGNTEK
jgi:hypothetical protein